MSSSSLRILTTLGLLALAGCGFKPVYGEHSAGKSPSAAQQFAAIDIPVMPNRLGQQMRNLLIDSLHPHGADTDYRYRLEVGITEAVINLGLQQNSTSTRGQVRLTVRYALIDNSNGKVVLKVRFGAGVVTGGKVKVKIGGLHGKAKVNAKGVATITLRHVHKGKHKVVVTYQGSSKTVKKKVHLTVRTP